MPRIKYKGRTYAFPYTKEGNKKAKALIKKGGKRISGGNY